VATRIGIDTGGTFTDVVRLERTGVVVHKLASTPDDPARAVLAGLAAVRRRPQEAVDVVHGTTVGLNAVLTGRLARTAFVTNQGFEDLIEVGRQQREDLYALQPQRAVPPVPRALRFGVACRRDAQGNVLQELRPAAIRTLIARLRQQRPAAVAVGLLHAPADPSDELQLAAAIRQALPDVPVTTSSELLPVAGEYERFCTAILNAAIAPAVAGYTDRLAQHIGPGRLRLLRSSLGILSPEEAARFPARAMFSGPAGGVLATGQAFAGTPWPFAAALDIGGTSADLCLVNSNRTEIAPGQIAGLPLALPTVAVHTVGCGGGSIAYVDAGGALRVGPASAGADPGPAGYGRGGPPTVTDAHLVLGHLGADTLLEGAFPIDLDAAVRALERLGKQLGLGAAATARGILTVAEATMARAMLVITAERAVDPAAVPLCAYGGAGGLHAAGLATRLGLPGVLIPAHPGAFSALGLCLAGESSERSLAIREPLTPGGETRLLRLGRELLAATAADLPGRSHRQLDVVLRYAGQGQGLRLPLRRGLAAAFAAEHQRRFGFVATSAVEATAIHARAERSSKPLPQAIGAPTPARQPARHRRPPARGTPWPVWRRAELAVGQRVTGPAIVEELTATTVVPGGHAVEVTPRGLWLSRTAWSEKKIPAT
jgi:N-methylhydantoinase A